MTETPIEANWDKDYAAAEAEVLKRLGEFEKVLGPTPAVLDARQAVVTDMRQAYNEKTAAIRADRDAKASEIVELKAELAKK